MDIPASESMPHVLSTLCKFDFRTNAPFFTGFLGMKLMIGASKNGDRNDAISASSSLSLSLFAPFFPTLAIALNFFFIAEASITLIAFFCLLENVVALVCPFAGLSSFSCSKRQAAPRRQLPFWKSKQGFFSPDVFVFFSPPC